jgi:ABC-type dipeptide/oligopeptide/nickel transport system permease component
MNSPRFWLGVALVLIGGVWFGQGMGWIGGGAMSGVALWAIVGPAVALVGIALALQAVRAKR